jgi:hypothetical protein
MVSRAADSMSAAPNNYSVGARRSRLKKACAVRLNGSRRIETRFAKRNIALAPKFVFPKNRIYSSAFKEKGRDDIVLWDILPIHDREKIKIVFESINSPWRQGVWLRTDNRLVINNVNCRQAVLWEDAAPKVVICECFTKDGLLSIYNIWDDGNGYKSQSHTSGMLVKELPQGRRYCCNDVGFDTNFDKLIFRIERSK